MRVHPFASSAASQAAPWHVLTQTVPNPQPGHCYSSRLHSHPHMRPPRLADCSPALPHADAAPVQTENRLKSALLNSQDMSGAAGVHSSQLEAQLAAQSTSLEGPISDLLQLYAHAFRADAAQTDTMARRILASINPNRASAGAEKALRLSDDLTRTLAQSVKRFLSIVTVRSPCVLRAVLCVPAAPARLLRRGICSPVLARAALYCNVRA